MRDTIKVAPGQTGSVQSQLFAGAKQMKILQAYQNSGIQQFDLLIDWGWFFFITKPLFLLMDGDQLDRPATSASRSSSSPSS